MNQDNRVLARTQARELTQKEAENVSGGMRTLTVCTVDGPNFRDGDVGEC